MHSWHKRTSGLKMNFLSYNKYTVVGIFLLYVERLRVVGVASVTEQCADWSVSLSLVVIFVSASWQFFNDL